MCYYDYDESLREQVTNPCDGSIVEVIGRATLDIEGRVKQIDSVTGVEAVSMEPIRLSKFEHGEHRYRLREAVPFSIEFGEGVWAYSNDALGIRGYAFNRDEALRELHEAFDFAYQDIALEQDEALSPKAIELKKLLLELVGTQGSEGGERDEGELL